MDEQRHTMEDLFAHGYDDLLLEHIPETMHRMYFLSGLLYSSTGVSSWCLNMKGELMGNQYPSQHALLDFFYLGGNREYALEHAETVRSPMLLTDRMDMIWISDFYYCDNKPVLMFVVGPIFNGHSVLQNLETMMRKQNISPSLHRNLVECLKKVPIMSQTNVVQLAKMLHYSLSGEPTSSEDIHIRRSQNNLIDQSLVPEKGETADLGLVYGAEQVILQLVREGNIYGNAIAKKAFYCIDMDCHDDGTQNTFRNSVIGMIMLASRAAVEGGLSRRTAKEIEVYYIRNIENCSSYSDLLLLRGNMLREFTTQVHNCKKNLNLSPVIQDCCTYIHSHVSQQITLEEIASAVGYTEYYLTKKFKNETGVRMVDYIKEARIQQAKVLLLSELSIQEISDELQFNTRSYFSKVFKEVTGMTPVQYRESNGIGVTDHEN